MFTGNFDTDIDKYRKIEKSKLERITLVTGHSPRFTGIEEIDNLPTITFLRNPVSRVKSFCQHVSEGKSPYLFYRFPPDSFDLNEFIESGNVELSNLQTKILLGEKSFNLPDGDTKALVDKAISVLKNNITCFGITEHFDDSLILFRYKMEWTKWPIYQKLNIRNKSRLIKFSEEHLAKIKQINDIDIQVYEKALQLFKNNINDISEYLKINITQFCRYQKMSQVLFMPNEYFRKGKSLIKSFKGFK
jgi:hypothetical protein